MFQTDDGVVHVGEIPSGKELFTCELSGRESISTFRFSPNGAQLFTGGIGGDIQIWDGYTGKRLRSVQAHRASIVRFDYSADGRYYASLSQDGSMQVWDTLSHAAVGLPLLQEGVAARADFSPDGSRIVTPSSGGTARIWDVASGIPLTDALGHEGNSVSIVAYAPGGRFVTTQATGAGVKNPAQRLWAAPPEPSARTPDWLLRLATICSGQRLNEDGKLASAGDEMVKLDDVRREVAALSANDEYAEWGRWILSDSPTRSIAPGFTITPAEAEKLAASLAPPPPSIAPAPAPAPKP